ncbi:MAG TPA: TolC family protein [Bryobacteraceae bacterium]|jgi:outer membrane protein TolC|nr:TolC family protein [Bryobacteraceae bacterium]
MRLLVSVAMFFWLVSKPVPAAEQAPAASLTLAEVVASAARNYPSVRVSQEQINAAAAGIRLARTAYLPRVDTLALVNRATRNNVFGLLLPQSVIPSMSGPVIGSNNFGTAWGSAIGGLVSWEPFDFGLRRANVSVAEAARAQSAATLKRTEFEISTAAIDAYLTLAAGQETVRAAQAGVDRAETVARTTNALVGAQLRPGADQSRAEAEVAAARTQLIQARQAVDVARATLAQFISLDPSEISISSQGLLRLPADESPASVDFHSNPLVGEQNATVEQARAELKSLERSYFPEFSLQGAVYARGTGAEVNGDRLGGVNGLAPNVQNYALGFSVTFPVMDLASIHARQEAQSATIRAQTARAELIVTELRARWNIALAQLRGARDIAGNTPVQIAAARAASEQATARYQSGLSKIDQVAEAQRLLTQAEIDDALSHLGVWRALLGLATAAGDLQPFVMEASK